MDPGRSLKLACSLIKSGLASLEHSIMTLAIYGEFRSGLGRQNQKDSLS